MDNYLNNTDPIPLRHTPHTIVILSAAYLAVLIVGLAGNFFVIAVVGKIPKMKTATKYFIRNLAVADLLVLIFCLLPNLISSIYVPWVMGSLMCKAVPYIQGVSVYASVYSLAAISGDRLLGVRFPLRRQVTKSIAWRIIALIWIWAAGLALPWLLYFEISNADMRDPSLVFCLESWPSQIYGNMYFVLVNLGLFYLFPLAFISFSHFMIWLRVRSRQCLADSSVSQVESGRKRAQASVQKLNILVVVGFAVCWLPLYVIFVRIKLIPAVVGATEGQVLGYALPIAQWLGAANSCINPILYVFFNRSFRFALRRLIGRSWTYTTSTNCPNPHHRHNNSNERRLNVVRLSITHHRSHPKNIKLKDQCHNVDDSTDEFNAVIIHPKYPKLAAIRRSQTYMTAMENPLP